MKRIDTRLIGIDEGEAVVFAEHDSGGTMWTGEGERTRRRSVRFSGQFRDPPVVQCVLSMWDIDGTANARVEVDPERITEQGFDVVVRTWGDTRIARARVRWTAIGEVVDDDDWELY